MDRELQRKVVRGLAVVAAIVAVLLILMFVRGGRDSSPSTAVAIAREPVAAAAKPAPAQPPAPAPTAAPRATSAPVATPIPATPEPTPAPEETLTVEQSAMGPLWLVGTVRDEAGEVVEGADVMLDRYVMKAPTLYAGAGQPAISSLESLGRAKTDAKGYYELALPKDPPFVTSVESPGYARIASNLYLREMLPITAPDGRLIVRRDFSLGKGLRFAGRVVDDEKKPVPEATVGLRGGMQTVTDDVGNFSFTISPKTEMAVIQLSKAHHAAVEYEVTDFASEKDWLLAKLGGRIAGRVLDMEGNPIPALAVAAYASKPANFSNPDPVGVETITDGQGAFVFQPMAAGPWRLVAQDPVPGRFGLQKSAHQEVTLGELQSVEGVELRMPAALIIHGIVVTGPDETPVEGAEIRLGKGDPAPFLSGVDGRFELTDLHVTREQWRGIRGSIVVLKEGFRPGRLEEGDYRIQDSLPIQEKAILVADDAVAVSGRVVDHNGVRVRDVVVVAQDYPNERALTDSQGRFTVKAVRNRPLSLKAIPPAGPPTFHPLVEVKDSPITGIGIVLDPGAALELVVLDPEGKPVEGARVWAMRRIYAGNSSGGTNFQQETSDASGRVVFKGFPATGSTLDPAIQRASVDAGASHPDYAEVEVTDIKLAPGATTRQELRLPAKGTATLDGYVRDEAGNAIEGAIVQVQGTSGSSTKSDPLGFFHVGNLLPGKYYLVATHPKYYIASIDFEAPASDLVITMSKRK